MTISTRPRWATEARQEYLSSLLLEYLHDRKGWQCDLLSGDFHNPAYEKRINGLIKDWQAYDREQDRAEWQAEQKRIHSLGEKILPLRGRFSAVAREVYHDQQPLYYLVGLGMSGLTLRPFAKVRLASSYQCLHIDLGTSLRHMSKHKRRKATRYGGGIPVAIERNVNALIHSTIMYDRVH
jgi:hypothetical protein